jgi:hypothetical protein
MLRRGFLPHPLRVSPEGLGFNRGYLAGYSLDRLVRFLVLLGSDVKIVVKPRASGPGQARVIVA